ASAFRTFVSWSPPDRAVVPGQRRSACEAADSVANDAADAGLRRFAAVVGVAAAARLRRPAASPAGALPVVAGAARVEPRRVALRSGSVAFTPARRFTCRLAAVRFVVAVFAGARWAVAGF